MDTSPCSRRRALILTLTLVAMAAALLAGAQPAAAQGSVTLYGSVDAGVIYSTNQQNPAGGGHGVEVGGGYLMPSRWGLMGSEPLGGNLKAVFALENQFLTGNGAMLQAGSLFDRQAWVGLSDSRWGTLGFGRQYDSYSDFLGVYASSNSWSTPYGSHFGDIDNLNEAFNMNNAVKFTSASLRGFTFGGTFAFGGRAGQFAAARGYAVAAAYTHGPFSIGAGYMTQNAPRNTVLGGESGYFGDLACSNAGAMFCRLQDAATIKAAGIGASLAMGKANVAMVYTHTKLEDSAYFASAARPDGRSVVFDSAELNATYALSSDWSVGAAYIFNRAQVSDGGTTLIHQLNLGTTYALSKRTALYGVAIGQVSGGAGLGYDGATGRSVNYAQIPNLQNSGSSRQLAVMGGIRVVF